VDAGKVMGRIYQKVNQWFRPSEQGVLVEIGSDRGEGSTHWFNSLAAQHRKKLISVDVVSKAKSRWQDELTNTEFVVQDGAEWAQQFAQTNVTIDLLYLDNFDYIWDINNVSAAIELQMLEYSQRGVTMTNQQCQVAHLKQLIALHSCLSPTAVVVFDDTYCYNDCWIGKCGAAVVYLLSQGWHVADQSLDCGVILTK
jgi:hypothetical protein